MIRRRCEPSTSLRVSSPAVPHYQTWTLSAEANKKSETCNVCFPIRQLHMRDGTVHKHGSRDNPCSGSHQPPLSDSVHSHPATRSFKTNTSVTNHTAAPAGLATSPPDICTVAGTTTTLSSTTASVDMVTANTNQPINHSINQSITVKHPCRSRPVLKRNPKGARPGAAILLQKLKYVLLHSSSSSSWWKLLGFSSASLSRPNRGGKYGI
jgi:hypothetical protein